MDIDRDILKLLLRRHNVLQKLRAAKGGSQGRSGAQTDAKTEQALRAAWESNASRISRDPQVTRRLFSLLQELHFLPRPEPGEEQRPAFGLAPVDRPVRLEMPGPRACRRVRLYLALAAGSGQALRMGDTLLNDPLIECVKAFNQAGARLAREEDGAVLARPGDPLPLPDKVIFVGNDALNFHLLLGHYLLRPSHAKFTGDTELKLADFSAVRRFLPLLGARLTSVIPKSDGLPVRLEASGMLPESVAVPSDLPDDAVTGLLAAAPCAPQALSFDLSAHARAELLLGEMLDIFRECGVRFEQNGRKLRVEPGLKMPPEPPVGMDLLLAANLLALPAFSGGSVRLTGIWPQCGPARDLVRLLEGAGLRITSGDKAVRSERPDKSAAPAHPPDTAKLPARFAPLALALAALPALRGQKNRLPVLPDEADAEESADFLRALGIELEGKTLLPPPGPARREDPPWTAPTPALALAFALCAFARPRLKLANPGVMTGLYPSFWALYNSLAPAKALPDENNDRKEQTHDKPTRKRLRVDGYVPEPGETPGGTED